MPKKSLPTMKDVAQEAGVALGTVSKVFNGIPVGDSYRLRVEAAAKKLGYQVNQYARGLRASKTYTVAVILPGVDHPFFAALAQHLCTALAQRDHRMLLYVTASRPDIEQRCVTMVQQNRVDGIIGLTYNPLTVDEDLPFVGIDRSFRADIPCVAADNYGGGRLAAEKLLALGCKHLAFLRTGSASPGETDKRGDGFEAVCRARQVPYETLRRNDGEDGPEVFREFFRARMTDGRLDIDGIFCSWGSWGSGCRRTCRSSALTASGGSARGSSTAPPSSSRSGRSRRPAWTCSWRRTAPRPPPWSACR